MAGNEHSGEIITHHRSYTQNHTCEIYFANNMACMLRMMCKKEIESSEIRARSSIAMHTLFVLNVIVNL